MKCMWSVNYAGGCINYNVCNKNSNKCLFQGRENECPQAEESNSLASKFKLALEKAKSNDNLG